MSSTRSKVIHLYKNLLFLGREYPKGYDYFKIRLKEAFMKNKDVKETHQIELLLARGHRAEFNLESKHGRLYRPRKKSIGKRSKAEKAILKKEKEQQQLEAIEIEKSVEPEVIHTAAPAVIQQDFKSKEKEHHELVSLFSNLNTLYKNKKYLKWEDKCWYNYVYKCREIKPLILPEVNAYLTELDEDDACDIMQVFDDCRKSEQMCEDIKHALLECPDITPKTQKSWIQSIKNLQFMMRKKMDLATFRILRAANEHINDETFNMEFGVTDQSSNQPRFSFCLWGNLTKNLRHKGMNLPSTGFSFELPPELLKMSCAVRIWHSMFDNVTPTFCESSVPCTWQLGEVIVKDGVREFFSNAGSEEARRFALFRLGYAIWRKIKQP
ncbi:Protein CASC1 [Araneus ventricosus]|uniref:Protein CASC1 n=1 Tax=Araneus ventricosus TaxID=182803 RepID=A0A4Y2HUS6_ARAVE|nr:Protein CASC1 [Araneus ventricosus]